MEAILVLIRTHLEQSVCSEPVLSKADKFARYKFDDAYHYVRAGRLLKGPSDVTSANRPSRRLNWVLELRAAEENVNQRRYKLLGAAAHIVQSALSGR